MYFWLGSFQNYPFSRTGYNFVVANVNSFEKRGPHLEIRVANAQKHTTESFFLEWGGGRVIYHYHLVCFPIQQRNQVVSLIKPSKYIP